MNYYYIVFWGSGPLVIKLSPYLVCLCFELPPHQDQHLPVFSGTANPSAALRFQRRHSLNFQRPLGFLGSPCRTCSTVGRRPNSAVHRNKQQWKRDQEEGEQKPEPQLKGHSEPSQFWTGSLVVRLKTCRDVQVTLTTSCTFWWFVFRHDKHEMWLFYCSIKIQKTRLV